MRRALVAAAAAFALGWFGGAYTQDVRCDEALDYAYEKYSLQEPPADEDCGGDDECVQQCVDSLQPDEDPSVCLDVLGARNDEEEE